jgi:CubicO group peptidase (beta-lactamase class C family)
MTGTCQRPTHSTLESCVLQELGSWTVPGMAIGVLQDGRFDTFGFGVTSLETGQPVTAETLFQIGSITKVYTATLVMRLVEDGHLDLDTPVATYLPDLRLADLEAQRSVTLRHLLTHTSGLEGDRFVDYGMGDDALQKAIAEFHSLRQLTPPGTLWSYCNTGFNLAGAVVEQSTGTPFETAMRERLLGPLGASRSFFFAHEAITYPVAVGHEQKTPEAAPEVVRPYPVPRCINPAGGLIVTVGDLLRFATLHLCDGLVGGTRLLHESSVRSMQQPQAQAANFADALGLGWIVRTIEGRTVIGHWGTTNGFRAQVVLVPGTGFAMAMLSNGSRGHAAMRRIETWALEHYCGIRHEEPALIRLSPPTLRVFAGLYEEPYARLTISIHDSGLRVERTRKDPETNVEEPDPPFLMAPVSAREFRIIEGEDEGLRVDFILDNDGKPRFVRMRGRLADRVDR